MISYLSHFYFLMHATTRDASKVHMTDLKNATIFKVTVPNIEKQIQIKQQEPLRYKKMKKWDYTGDDGCLSYPVTDSNIAERVFQTF